MRAGHTHTSTHTWLLAVAVSLKMADTLQKDVSQRPIHKRRSGPGHCCRRPGRHRLWPWLWLGHSYHRPAAAINLRPMSSCDINQAKDLWRIAQLGGDNEPSIRPTLSGTLTCDCHCREQHCCWWSRSANDKLHRLLIYQTNTYVRDFVSNCPRLPELMLCSKTNKPFRGFAWLGYQD